MEYRYIYIAVGALFLEQPPRALIYCMLEAWYIYFVISLLFIMLMVHSGFQGNMLFHLRDYDICAFAVTL